MSIAAFELAVLFWPYPASAERPPAAATVILDRSGQPLAAYASNSGEWCFPLRENEISPHLLDAVVAVEDQRFYGHGGVDWRSAIGAAWQNLRSLSLHRGASTVTMQLVHLREPRRRSIIAKIVQAIRSCQVERKSSKREILVEYLNRAPFGGNLVGAGAASWRYFGRRCADLSLGQAALLAGLPQSPNRFRPDRYPQLARVRRDHVLDRMLAAGMITARQRIDAGKEPVDAVWRPLPQEAEEIGIRPLATEMTSKTPGRVIQTTIDRALQRQISTAVADQLRSLEASHVTSAAAVVVDVQTGECLASVSRSIGCPDSAPDLTIAARSSGSVLKPMIYAAAFDAGICSPRTVLDDSPASWAGYQPSNYDRQFDGPIPAAEALAQSRNVPALYVLSKVGIGRAVEVMRASGLATLARTPERYGLSLAIGGAEVTPMEVVEAYMTLARGGRHVEVSLVENRDKQPSLISGGGSPGTMEKIAHSTDQTGASAPGYPRTDAKRSRLSLQHIGAILRSSSCLQVLQCLGDIERTRRVCAGAVDLAPAWKTGTSSGHRDAWCAAVTPRRVVVVWMGNGDGSGSDALVGQDAAAPLALRILTEVDRPAGPVAGFAPPPGFLSGNVNEPERPTQPVLAMVSPSEHQQILRDSSLPNDQQRFPLRAREVGSDPGALWWFIDGQCIGSCESSEHLWWNPEAGNHEVRVVDAAGRSAVSRVSVRASSSE